MFESAELGHKIDKKTYSAEVPALREDLLDVQLELFQRREFSVIILVGGVDGAGRGETVNLLNEWMDPRFIQTHGMGEPSEEELERPHMWRFWRALPPKGKIGVFLGSWYTWPILNRAAGKTKNADLEQSLERAKRFEKMLSEEGTLILKFWLHLSKSKQKKRLEELEKDPTTRWRVTERDWEHFKDYEKFRSISERVIRHTSTASAPWFIVEGEDPRYRGLTVGKLILEALQKRLKVEKAAEVAIHAPPLLPSIDGMNLLHRLDLSHTLEKKDYEEELNRYQGKLALLTRDPGFRKKTLVLVFEGNDAAGKGGAIRRITGALDARFYQVIPIAAPTEEEREQPYLWRFWRHIPRRGRLAIFDRSWYGRVLVERVEGYCTEADWMRAYSEIIDFESQLVRHDIFVAKYWLAISKEEQLKRFNARKETGFKRYKITDEDWRNREKWDIYEKAICDMVERTSTELAPWTLVEANDKSYARIKIMRDLCERFEEFL